MFITLPQFEQSMSGSTAANQQWWRAVTVFAASHWFLFAYEADWEGQKVPESAMAEDAWTLVSLVSNISPGSRKAVARAEKVGARWHLQWLNALWLAAGEEVESRGVLLLQFEGEHVIRDCHMQPVPSAEGRRLLFRSQDSAWTSRSATETPQD